MIRIKNIFLVTVALFLAVPMFAHAATLSISPSSAEVKQGDTITVNVRLDTSGQAVNAVQTTVHFPSDKLKLISATPGSIFNLLTPNSPFIDTNKVAFSAGAVSPGFTGKSGTILTLKFSAQTQGSATITLDSGKALLNDGSGTDSLTSSTGATIIINSQNEDIPVTPSTDDTPTTISTFDDAPQVTSETHPDQKKWYAKNTVTLSWPRPEGIYGFSFILDQDPNTVPDDTLDTTITTNKTYSSVPDGVWYFHIKARGPSKNTAFTPTTIYRIAIDTEAPTLPKVDIVEAGDTSADSGVSFQSEDKQSGIDHYEIIVDGEKLSGQVKSPYILNTLRPGVHQVEIVAYDAAGNHSSSSVYISIVSSSRYFSINDFIQNNALTIVSLLLVENVLLLGLIGVLVFFLLKHNKHVNDTKKSRKNT